MVRYWFDYVRSRIAAAITLVVDELITFSSYDPFNDNFLDKSGHCTLSLKIAIWAVDVSRRSLNACDAVAVASWSPEYDPIVQRIVQSRGFNVIRIIACIGADSDTYGAIAAPLLAALYPNDVMDSIYANEIDAEYKDEIEKALKAID